MTEHLTPEQDAAGRVHDELWRHLDWSFWGTGMADVFREPLADAMLAGITREQRQEANDLIDRWRDHREFVGRDKYEAQKAEIEQLRKQLAEMTRCRDNALTALHRDNVPTDIDLVETMSDAFCGPGWDIEDETAHRQVLEEAAAAVRPAFGKLTQERDRARAELAGARDKALVEVESTLLGLVRLMRPENFRLSGMAFATGVVQGMQMAPARADAEAGQ